MRQAPKITVSRDVGRYLRFENFFLVEPVDSSLISLISAIVNDLQDAKFVIDSSEEEAGRLVLSLLRDDKSNTDSRELPESEAFQMAALQLHITSPRAILIEKRSIKKLLEKVRDTDQRKEDILKYLLFLLRKYGNSASCEQAENADAQCKGSLPNADSACKSSQSEKIDESTKLGQNRNSGYSEAQTDRCSAEMAPEEFKCPISSKLMFDPVIIASGQTYERLCIEKWFSDGHDICPRTQMKLSNFSATPNTCVKDLISKWCSEHGVNNQNPHAQLIPAVLSSWNNSYSSSISSFGSSFNSVPTLPSDSHTSDYTNQSDISNISISSFDLDSSHVNCTGSLNNGRTQIFSWYHDSDNSQPFAYFSQEMYLDFFSKLASLPLDIRFKAIEDFKIFLKANDEACDAMHSNGFMDVLMKYLMDARDLSNVEAQRTGAQVLLAFASNTRKGMPPLHEESFELLVSFIESDISKEVLTIIQVLADHQSFRSKIMTSAALPKLIKILDSKSNEVLVPVVKILLDLSYDTDFRLHILSSGCIEKLVQLLGCGEVAGNCIRILENVCETEEARAAILGTNGCIESIAELLDTGTQDEQEHAVAILLSICSYSSDYCQLVMNEGVIPSLVSTSINGTSRGKESAMKLLQLLRDLRRKDALDSFHPPPVVPYSELSPDSDTGCKEKQPAPKSSSFFRRKLNIFIKHRSFALSLDRR
ncbi:hypothetical protein ACLOJK_001781 [Asimina triloba]